MERRHLNRLQLWLKCAVAAVAYFICAVLSLELTKGMDGIAFLWPASGVAVAGISIVRRSYRYQFAGCIAVASLAANLVEGTTLATSIGFTIANVAECLIVALYLGRRDALPPTFEDRKSLLSFGIATLLAGATSAAIASITVANAVSIPGFFASWFCTVNLGILIVTPLVIELVKPIIFPARRKRAPLSLRWVAVLVAATVAGFVAFAQTDFPLLYLALASVILASFAGGTGGAIGAVFTIALIGSVMTTLGYGPIHLIRSDMHDQVVYFQFYLLTLLACGLPTASLLAEVRRNTAKLSEQNRLLAMAEETAKVGHWRMQIGADEVFWSSEVFRIHGIDRAGDMVPLSAAVGAYHPEDQPVVEKTITRSIVKMEPFFFEARLIRPDGSVRRVESHGNVELEDGEPIAMFGTILDVTDKAEAIDQLRAARQAAERQAETALHLAETDQLTGIANRRKLIGRLEECVRQAGALETPLAFVMFDVDNFKSINDTYGHGEGDGVLARIARISDACLRKGDLVGRMGGEEFGVVLPSTDLTTASKVAERIRAAIEEKGARGGSTGPLSVSLGVAELKQDMEAGDLLGAADLALYEAKASGKNCYRLAA